MTIQKENIIITDTNDNIINEDGKIECGCGKSLFRQTGHMDGAEWYTDLYVCKSCGNQISVCRKRDKRWW